MINTRTIKLELAGGETAASLSPNIRKEVQMKRRLASLMFLPVIVLPCLAQEPAPKPETKAPETAVAEALPTLDHILDKNVEALGGKAAIEKITSRTMSGSFEIPEMGATGTVKGIAKAPNKSLIIIDVPSYGIIQLGCDGTTAWSNDPMGGLREITGSDLAAAKRDYNFSQALHYKELFAKLTVKSKEKVGDKTAYLVEAAPAEGKAEKLYFDAATGLLLRHDMERDSGQGPALTENYFDDYKDIDGVKVAFTTKRVTPAFSITTKITEIKTNVDIEDAKFAKPSGQQ